MSEFKSQYDRQKESAKNAQSSETNAKTSENNAAASAESAQSSAESAANSAESAESRVTEAVNNAVAQATADAEAAAGEAKNAQSADPASIATACFLFFLKPKSAMGIPNNPPAVNAPNPRNKRFPESIRSKPWIRSPISSTTPVSISAAGTIAAIL